MNPKKPRRNCLYCGRECERSVDKFSNNKCQREYDYGQYIARWLNGEETGTKGSFMELSDNIRRWMFETYRSRCSECGWGKRHPITGKIPLSIHHIDGDIANNRPENLRLLCPNCHALTENWGALNRGKGKRPYHKGGYLTPNK